MASVWSNKIQNLSYRGTFQWIFDPELWHLVRVSWEFELSEFELSGFYCIYSITPHDKSECLTVYFIKQNYEGGILARYFINAHIVFNQGTQK